RCSGSERMAPGFPGWYRGGGAARSGLAVRGDSCHLRRVNILGIETSCDETAVAIVAYSNGRPEIRANLVQSQLAEHAPYGGVVPEIAARAHLDHLDRLIRQALDEAELGF